MLLAILYGPDESVLATAMACDHQSMGDQYWEQVQGLDLPENTETAYMPIDDPHIADQLLNLTENFVDGHRAALAIEQYEIQCGHSNHRRQAA